MIIDTRNNSIFNQDDVFKLLYRNDISVLNEILVEKNDDILQFENVAGVNLNHQPVYETTIGEYDKENQQQWHMPDMYYEFDILEHCLSKCTTDIETIRVLEELVEFEKRDLMKLLQWMKYFVDVCTTDSILWGIGRGSSVASYVLYLIGVHRIDSIKYNLDWKEFLRPQTS